MARWGEGDPRWLVENRSDGKNINAWHWEESNRFDWAKQRLAELLTGVEHQGGSVRVTKLNSLTGEAMLTRRKANKKFAVYDLTLTLQWEATGAKADKPVKGEIRIEEFASTSDESDYTFSVSVDGGDAGNESCKALAKSLQGQIYQRLATFVLELNELQ